MKNQITNVPKWVQSTLAVLILVMISFTSFSQNPGGGSGGGPTTGGNCGGGGNSGGGGNPGPHPGPNPHPWPNPNPGPNPWPHPSFTCNAHFFHLRDTVVNGIRFFNLPGSGAATYAWDFGDGSTSNVSNPNHAYADTGFYYVCLTVTDTVGGGCTDTKCDSIHVFTPPPHCNAHFHVRPDSIANTGNFHAGGRGWHNAASTATYAWDFGDGSTSTDQNPSHTFSPAGTYYVCLTVSNTNAGGSCTDTWCDSVNSAFPMHPHPHHFKLASGIESASAAPVVSVYPNPMVESAIIHLENTSGNSTFTLYGINGQVVMTRELVNGDNKISKENLNEGLYFYTIFDSNTNIAKGKLRVN